MPFVEREFDRFVDVVYEAPFDVALWPEALELLARPIDALGTVLTPAGAPFAVSRYAPDALREGAIAYDMHWWREDFIGERILRLGRQGVVVDERDLFTPEEIARSSYFQEFRRQFGVGDRLVFCDRGENGSNMAIAAQLPPGRPPVSAEERKIFELYIRHAARALRMAARLKTPLAATSMLEDALDALATPAAILGADKRVAFANRPFEALEARGLKILDRRLIAPSPSQQSDLDKLIGEALAQPSATSANGALTLRCATGRPLVAQIAPLPVSNRHAVDALPSQRAALALVTDPDARRATDEAALIALGLTVAEARLALLIGAGLSPPKAARNLGNSEATARTHLKRVFSKLGLERQSQLASLVARLGAFA